jgi:TonB family protein
MLIHPTHRFLRPAPLLVGLGLLASCSASPRAARAPAPTPAECQAKEAAGLARSGVLPGANLDSMREARLDSAMVRFRERRPLRPDTAERMDRNPVLVNSESIQRWMGTYYPPALARQGIGGSTLLVFFSRPDSTVEKVRVLRSSGWSELDLASVRVIQEARMVPGMYHGCPVWAMISMPITWVPPAPPRPRN